MRKKRGYVAGSFLAGKDRVLLQRVGVMATTSVYVDPNTGGVQAGLMNFRNGIINGDMRVNQRGTSTNLSAMTAVGATFGYVCDRWGVYRTGYGTGAQIGQGTNLTISDRPFSEAGISTYARIGRIVNDTSTNTIILAYAFESRDSLRYVGRTVTLSFYYRMGASFSGASFVVDILRGTGIDEGMQRGAYITGSSSVAVVMPNSTNWIKKSLTAPVSSPVNQIGIMFGYSPINSSLAGSSDYFDVTGIQLEIGPFATPFEVRPYPVELGLCQRYYCAIPNFNGIAATGEGRMIATNNGTNANLIGGTIYFPATMRASPSVTFFGGNVSTGNVSYYTAGSGAQAAYSIAANNFMPQKYSSTMLSFATLTTTIGTNYSAWIDMGWAANNLGLKSECEL